VVDNGDMYFWKMMVASDGWYCSSFVLYYKEGSFLGRQIFAGLNDRTFLDRKGTK
jgi:hypothetical protein